MINQTSSPSPQNTYRCVQKLNLFTWALNFLTSPVRTRHKLLDSGLPCNSRTCRHRSDLTKLTKINKKPWALSSRALRGSAKRSDTVYVTLFWIVIQMLLLCNVKMNLPLIPQSAVISSLFLLYNKIRILHKYADDSVIMWLLQGLKSVIFYFLNYMSNLKKSQQKKSKWTHDTNKTINIRTKTLNWSLKLTGSQSRSFERFIKTLQQHIGQN